MVDNKKTYSCVDFDLDKDIVDNTIEEYVNSHYDEFVLFSIEKAKDESIGGSGIINWYTNTMSNKCSSFPKYVTVFETGNYNICGKQKHCIKGEQIDIDLYLCKGNLPLIQKM